MHFSKTYTQLLMQLPLELRENSIQYRQLKKVINRIVGELTALGLDPELLGSLMVDSSGAPVPVTGSSASGIEEVGGDGEEGERQPLDLTGRRVVYELEEEVVEGDSEAHSGVLKPRLRIVDDHPSSEIVDSDGVVIIPLVHDGEFYRLLSEALMALQSYLQGVKEEFGEKVRGVARDVGDSSGPSHSTSVGKFQPFSAVESDAGNVKVRRGHVESDLYVWREVFKVYVEMEVFESMAERTRGERSVEDVEERMRKFVGVIEGSGFKGFKMSESRRAWTNFLALNAFVLDVKKLTYANSEATRKILKKHAKRTSLSHSSDDSALNAFLSPLACASGLTRMLVQAIGERLLVVIPHVDDYMCLICVELAFKPIRLGCGHLFCVRCLVKMQKGGKGRCPMCREECVLSANRTNVDWGLLNFMQDWFPVEAREKLKANEKEAAEEQMREMGIDPNGCVIM